MRSVVSPLTIETPRTLGDALSMLRDAPLVPIAGATDLYVGLNFGTLSSQRFIDITRIEELRGIDVRDDMLVIGAGTNFTALMQSATVQTRLPMLAQAASQIGGVQIQNRGTIGGNIANGSPAGDSLPVLAAADAILVLRSASDERRVPFTNFYTGYRTSVLRGDELIVSIEIKAFEGKQWFRKVGTRAAQAISKLVIAAVRSDAPRIAIGSVAATTVRLPHTEAALAAGASIDEAVNTLESEITPIDDVRSSADYRRKVAGNLLKRFWAETE
ncbi:MAG: molybdopterin dehydrogenase FAD-binding protein [Gemmatimonadetes bacterium]|nr:molybdopterin dehydrogenase FAD-binding protein [Gemmatimonadota bacterium]